MTLPPQVIERLLKYIHDGCELEMTTEQYNGDTIYRWIANDNLVLWSTAGEQADE